MKHIRSNLVLTPDNAQQFERNLDSTKGGIL